MEYKKLQIGKKYSRKLLDQILETDCFKKSREGLVYPQGHTFLFITLDKRNKNEDLRYNDYFEDNLFHWDSQNPQHINTPKIKEMVLGKVKVHLLVRVFDKIKGKTQPYTYCGLLGYFKHDPATNRPESKLTPVHIIFKSLDYDESPNENLKEIYNWSSVTQLLGLIEDELEDDNDFDVLDLTDARKKVIKTIVQRRGQKEFRRQLLEAYTGKCAVTRTGYPQVLEAAHIMPYKGEHTNDISNGILLRSDIHTLFDLGLISIADDYKILMKSELMVTEYAELMGVILELPESQEMRPNLEALAYHREEFGFKT